MTGSEVFEGREGTRLVITLSEIDSALRKLNPEPVVLGSPGAGKSMLLAHLLSTTLLARRVHRLPFRDTCFALTKLDSGKVWNLPPSGPTCGNCSSGRNLEASIADFQRCRRFPQHRNPSLTTRRDLLGERKPLSPFDALPQVNGLFENEPPSFPSPAAHSCTLPPLLLAREIHPDHQEMLVQLLKRIIRIILLVRKLMAAYLRRLSYVPTFGLLMMAAILRYGHRHDSDDDLSFPLRRCMIPAGGATAI